MTYYKTLENGRSVCGGSYEWSLPTKEGPGKWSHWVQDIVLCEAGYHLCKGILGLPGWFRRELYEAEPQGATINSVDGDKLVCQSARLIRRVDNWNERTVRLLGTYLVENTSLITYEHAFPGDRRMRDVIEASKRYANGQAREEDLREVRQIALKTQPPIGATIEVVNAAQRCTEVAYSDPWVMLHGLYRGLIMNRNSYTSIASHIPEILLVKALRSTIETGNI